MKVTLPPTETRPVALDDIPTPVAKPIIPPTESPIPEPTGPRKIDIKQSSPIADVLNVPRALKASVDFSFPFRQGLGMIHTKSWWQSWEKGARAYGSQKAFDNQMAEILARDNHKPTNVGGKEIPSFSEQAGLKLADITDVSKREESNMSQLAEKIPGLGRLVRGSTRAHIAFANKLRADNFDRLIANAERAAGNDVNLNPKQNLALAKQFAEYVNTATGRGSLGRFEKNAQELNALFFSPRLIASRVQMLNPANYTATAPAVRKEYLKSMLAMAGVWQGMVTGAGLAKELGANVDVSMDTTSSDFGKIKIGDTRIDPAGGLQQYLVILNKMAEWGRTSTLTNKHKNYGEGFNAPTFGEDFLRFMQNKLAPIPNLATRATFATTEKKSANPPLKIGDEAIRLVTPIILEDLSEIIQEDPDLLWTLIPSSVGMSTQTYGKESRDTRLLGDFMKDQDFTFPLRRRK